MQGVGCWSQAAKGTQDADRSLWVMIGTRSAVLLRQVIGLRSVVSNAAAAAPPVCGIISGTGGISGHQGGRSGPRVHKGQKKKKLRQHVNPLDRNHQQLLDLPERWPEHSFVLPSQPLHVDIGSARGLFCLDLAAAQPNANVLGIEIRAVFAEAAAADAKKYELGNAAFVASNANVNLEPLLVGASECCELRSVSIQFPDPW